MRHFLLVFVRLKRNPFGVQRQPICCIIISSRYYYYYKIWIFRRVYANGERASMIDEMLGDHTQTVGIERRRRQTFIPIMSSLVFLFQRNFLFVSLTHSPWAMDMGAITIIMDWLGNAFEFYSVPFVSSQQRIDVIVHTQMSTRVCHANG